MIIPCAYVVNKIYVLNILSQNKAKKTTSEKKMRCGIMRVKSDTIGADQHHCVCKCSQRNRIGKFYHRFRVKLSRLISRICRWLPTSGEERHMLVSIPKSSVEAPGAEISKNVLKSIKNPNNFLSRRFMIFMFMLFLLFQRSSWM